MTRPWLDANGNTFPYRKLIHVASLKARIGWQSLRTEEFVDEGPYCVTGTDFQNGRINWSTAYHVSAERYEMDRNIQLNEGDLLVTKDGTIGKVAVVHGLDAPATLNSGVFVVRPKTGELSTDFLGWVIRSKVFDDFVAFNFSGSTINHLYQNVFETFRFPYPDLATQRQIADFLDRETARIDLLIEKKQKMVALLGEKWQATLTHLTNKGLNFTPLISPSNRWIGAIPQHWKVVRLKHLLASEIAAIKPGPFGSDLRSSDMEGDYATVVNQRAVLDNDFSRREVAVTKEKYEELRSFSIRGGDILLTSRGTIGRAAIAPTDVTLSIIHPCVIRVRLNEEKILPEYFLHLLKESSFLAQVFDLSNATTIEVIYGNVLGEIAFPIPPVDEQIQINAEIKRKSEQSESATALIASSINRLKEYRSALITAAVTGKIDVTTYAKSGATDRRLDAIQVEMDV